MASRMSRKSVTTKTSTSSMETPTMSGISPGRRARSPSPARTTRIQEKEQLQNLNDRLAAYIDKVRFLENENKRLQIQVRSSEEYDERSKTNYKSMYESELAEARNLYDDIAKENTKLKLEGDKYKTEAGDWLAKYNRRDREAKNAEKKVLDLQSELAENEAHLKDAENAKKHAEAEAARLRAENANLERQLALIKKQLEDETLKRVDLENRIQSLKEELDFKSKVHEQELSESRVERSIIIDEVDSGVKEDYERKFQEALQSLRDEQEDRIRTNRLEMEDMYERQLGELQRGLDRSMSQDRSNREEYLITKKQIDDLNSEVVSLRTQNAELENRVRDLQNQMERERKRAEDDQQDLLRRISELLAQQKDMADEYADLMEVKLRLDNEIEAYRKLLEGEEERLNLSQSSSASSTPKKGGRGQKRKRVTLDLSEQKKYEYASETTAKGALEIQDTDHEGRFITIFNTGDDDLVLGGHVLKHTVGDGEKETSYKFHRNLQIKAGQTCTVWSSNADKTHNPPTDLVMKGQQWFVGDEMTTRLMLDDDEVASKTMTKEQRRSTLRYTRPGEADDSERREQCSIM